MSKTIQLWCGHRKLVQHTQGTRVVTCTIDGQQTIVKAEVHYTTEYVPMVDATDEEGQEVLFP